MRTASLFILLFCCACLNYTKHLDGAAKLIALTMCFLFPFYFGLCWDEIVTLMKKLVTHLLPSDRQSALWEGWWRFDTRRYRNPCAGHIVSAGSTPLCAASAWLRSVDPRCTCTGRPSAGGCLDDAPRRPEIDER